MTKPSEKGDVFAGLPRSNLARRFADVLENERKPLPAATEWFIGQALGPSAKAAIAKVVDAKRQAKGGRTRRPWIAAGVSKATWYRQRAKGK